MPDTELLHKSKPEAEPVRRLEVFTGAGRRRAWTPGRKAEIVAESYRGDETVSAVARRHGLTAQQLFGWRRQAERQVAAKGENCVTFAPVVVDTGRSCPSMPIAAEHQGGAALIEIVIGAATVRVAPGIDPVELTAILRVVRAVA